MVYTSEARAIDLYIDISFQDKKKIYENNTYFLKN